MEVMQSIVETINKWLLFLKPKNTKSFLSKGSATWVKMKSNSTAKIVLLVNAFGRSVKRSEQCRLSFRVRLSEPDGADRLCCLCVSHSAARLLLQARQYSRHNGKGATPTLCAQKKNNSLCKSSEAGCEQNFKHLHKFKICEFVQHHYV